MNPDYPIFVGTNENYMKKTLLFTTAALLSMTSIGQTQIGNSDLEAWESVSSGEEPVNWNSFMTASGGFSGFADVQIEPSTDVRPGSSGLTSARIWSRDAGFNVTANGNMTLGQINMGSFTASDPANHNKTVTGDADFSEAITDMPDSLVFWAKFTPITGGEIARVKATLHDNYDYKDPEDATSSSHVVATAELNYGETTGWERIAIAFDYSGPASTVEYILVTFTTNSTPGGGDPNDEVLIDDIELIYNPNSLEEAQLSNVNAFINNETREINFSYDADFDGEYAVYDMSGALVSSGMLLPTVPFDAPEGIYIVNVKMGTAVKQFKVYNK